MRTPIPGRVAAAASPHSPRAGVSVVPVPDCGHNTTPDNPQGFVRATAAALALPEGI
ncbi:hypothetical protein [Streptomyces rubiginosohelvolus]|uniref:hypothetical protein n=1 Tax=Streptomyces rubiginosohelvolus TaxID=67362 RepID=UPI003F4B1D07